MVIVGSEPPKPGGTVGSTLVETLPIITATAPAFCAFFTLTTKLHPPRLMNAIFPDTAPPIAEQPSTGFVPATFAVIPEELSGGPKSANPTLKFPANAGGEFT